MRIKKSQDPHFAMNTRRQHYTRLSNQQEENTEREGQEQEEQSRERQCFCSQACMQIVCFFMLGFCIAVFFLSIFHGTTQETIDLLSECVNTNTTLFYTPDGQLYPPPPSNLISSYPSPNVYVLFECKNSKTNTTQSAALGYTEPNPLFTNGPRDKYDVLYHLASQGRFAKTTAWIVTLNPVNHIMYVKWVVVLMLIAGGLLLFVGCISSVYSAPNRSSNIQQVRSGRDSARTTTTTTTRSNLSLPTNI